MSDESSGAVDVAVLRSIQADLAKVDRTNAVTFHPSPTDPRRVEAVLDDSRYPPAVEQARLECRWYLNGDYSVHYVEQHRDGMEWQCRWDRHPNPHNDRLHFHPPPDAGDPVDLDASSHVRDLLPMVLQWVDERVRKGGNVGSDQCVNPPSGGTERGRSPDEARTRKHRSRATEGSEARSAAWSARVQRPGAFEDSVAGNPR